MLVIPAEAAEKIASKLNYRHLEGTVVAVVQDAKSREVLMVGHMNREALVRTLTTGVLHLWSTSRGRLWIKGESSGNIHLVEDLVVDCDGDSVLVLVRPLGPTCHTGKRTCFHRGYRELL